MTTFPDIFEYDRSRPFDVRSEAPARDLAGAVRIEDITFASPHGGRVSAYVVVPPADKGIPAVLFTHAGQLDRGEFLEEAAYLARRGVLSLLMDAPFTRPEPVNTAVDAAADKHGVRLDIQAVVDMRRSLDLLEARPGIDPSRIAYVGHSYGASLGPILLALEVSRLRTAVLMAGHPANSEFYRNSPIMALDREAAEPATWDAYVRALEALDAIRYLPAVGCETLLQWARHDEFVADEDAARFASALGVEGVERWYDSDHYFDEVSRQDRVSWLLDHMTE